MKPLPADPMLRHSRLIDAFRADLASPEFIRTGRTPRADAVAAVDRATRRSS